MIELVQQVKDSRVFLRMAAIELRRIAEQTPDIAIELWDVAQKLEAEAADLAAAIPSDCGSEKRVNALHC